MQQCKNELKTEFREAIAATLKIQNNNDEVKNTKKTQRKHGMTNLKNEMIYFGDITEIKD